MNLDSLNKWLMLAANVGVIAGIIFLGLELNQNNELMEAEARAKRLDITTETWDLLSDSPEIIELLIRDRSGDTLDEKEEFRLNSFWMRILYQSQWQYQDLPEDRG